METYRQLKQTVCVIILFATQVLDSVQEIIHTTSGVTNFKVLVVLELTNVKIHMFVGQEPTFKSGELSSIESMASPEIKIDKSDTKNIFNRENNADFAFRGGVDWVLRPNDSEKFDFSISSSIGTKDPNRPHEKPYPSICRFICAIWADGLEKPFVQRIEVEITRNV